MSRISNALQQSDDPTAMLISEMIDTKQMPPAKARPAVATESEDVRIPTPRPAPAKSMPQTPPIRVDEIRTVPLKLSRQSPIFPFDGSDMRAAEQYRMVRTTLLHHVMQPRMVVISSAGSGDGKTISAANIASSLAMKNDENVLLVDGDLRRRSLTEVLGIPQSPGLANVLRGECTFEQAVVRVAEMPNLFVLAAGDSPANPAELLDSAQWKALTAMIRSRFRFTVVDSTPIAHVADFDLLQVVCDGVVLVVRPDHTNRASWKKTLDTVSKEKLLGVVLNAVEEWPLGPTHSTYYYG